MTLSDLEWLSEMFNDTKDRAVSLRRLSFLLPRQSARCCFWSVVFVTRQNRDQNSNLRNQDEDNKNTFSRQGCSSQGAHEHYAAPVFIPLPLLSPPLLSSPFPSSLPSREARGSGIALWAPPAGCGAEPHPRRVRSRAPVAKTFLVHFEWQKSWLQRCNDFCSFCADQYIQLDQYSAH